ncbi:MAG: aldehyde dehydrogenase EutE [bacterium]|nr:aldehyde dehydrogenase EutE [bacterium]
MVQIRQEEIQAIVQRVKDRLGHSGGAPAIAPAPAGVPPATRAAPAALGDGIFPTIGGAVDAAWEAFQSYREMGLDRRGEIVAEIRREMRERAEDLSRKACRETGLGRAEDKLRKSLLVIDKTPGTEDLEPEIRTGDRGLMVTEYAPYGVVAAITPTTNPTVTIINNTIGCVAAGNSVVFNVHPNAKAVSVETIHAINQAIGRAGGPPNLVTGIPEPTIESACELMNHPRSRILVVTGGPGVVEAALATRKRAITAGPGNPPAVVDETADVELAGREIVRGASFDNNVICTDEKLTIVVESVAERLLKAMQANHCVLLKEYQLRQLEKVIFRELGPPGKAGRINPTWIGQNAGKILGEIGITAGDEVRLALADVEADHCLVWTEQMMPVMPVVRVPDVDTAIDLAVRAEGGCGHTAAIFSRNVDTITRMARAIDVSIFVANGSTLAGLGDGGEGHTSFSIASPTGEGLTRPRSFSRLRRLTVVDGLRIV